MVQRKTRLLIWRIFNKNTWYNSLLFALEKILGHTHTHMKMDYCEHWKLMRWLLDWDTCCSSRNKSDSWVYSTSRRTMRSPSTVFVLQDPQRCCVCVFSQSSFFFSRSKNRKPARGRFDFRQHLSPPFIHQPSTTRTTLCPQIWIQPSFIITAVSPYPIKLFSTHIAVAVW